MALHMRSLFTREYKVTLKTLNWISDVVSKDYLGNYEGLHTPYYQRFPGEIFILTDERVHHEVSNRNLAWWLWSDYNELFQIPHDFRIIYEIYESIRTAYETLLVPTSSEKGRIQKHPRLNYKTLCFWVFDCWVPLRYLKELSRRSALLLRCLWTSSK